MSSAKDLLLVTLMLGVLFGATLGRYPVAAPDGARYAEIPREMVATGDYLTPRLNGVKYFEKPPLFYWLQAASIKLFGANEIAVSLMNALMALGTGLLIYLTGHKLYGRLSGLIATTIFATSSLVFTLTRVVTLDFALTFFLTGALAAFLLATKLPPGKTRNLYLSGLYLSSALAVLTKGLVGIIFPLLIILLWTAILSRWHALKTYHLLSGMLIFFLVALPWHLLVQLKNPEFFHFYFIEQHFLRYFTDYAGRAQKWWFFPSLLLGGLYPWVVFFPQAIKHHLPKNWARWREEPTALYLLLWVTTIYLFYTFSNSKLIPYLLPVFPPLALLLGNYLAAYWHTNQQSTISLGFNLLGMLNIILGGAAVAAIFILDFQEHIITKQNLYIVACWMIATALITIITYRRQGLARGFMVLALATAGLWLYLNPIITIINRQSIKPLIMAVQQQKKPHEEIICYGTYYQELPFYLGQKVTIANFTGELEFGTKQEDTTQWMINTTEFWRRWHSDKRVYLITRSDHYQTLKAKTPHKHKVIAHYLDNMLIVNTK